MQHLILLFGLILSLQVACKSKPDAKIDRGLGSGKITLDASKPHLIEILPTVAYAPRRGAEIETAILLNEGIQDCLRQAPEVREMTFSLGIEGKLLHTGRTEDIHVVCSSEALKACVQEQMPNVAFGRGRLGPFKMQITRPQGTELGGKPLLLDLSQGKKFE